jgi:hypothetical protein|tara:strand:- start:2 stop:511 length:510 start_codon:yes stop_codon:yes gene_type:complete
MKTSFLYYLFHIPKCAYEYNLHTTTSQLIQIVPNYSFFHYQKEEDMLRYNTKYRRNLKNALYKPGLVDNHHIIPKQFTNHKVIRDLHVDVGCSKNIVFLPNRHAKQVFENKRQIYHDSHPKYNTFVGNELNTLSSIHDMETKKYEFSLLFMYLLQGIEENDDHIRSLFS